MIQAQNVKVDILNYVLVVMFGLSSWIGINSVWVELPIFVRYLPESWTLPSFFSVVIQLGNFATLAFAVYNFRYAPKCPQPLRLKVERYSIYGLLIAQLIACAAAIFAWDVTSLVAGRERSTSLLVLLFFIAVADCSSGVVSLPFLSHFPSHRYVTAYYAGAGLSGFLPSMLSLIQGLYGTASGGKMASDTNGTTTDTVQSSSSFGVGPFFAVVTGLMLASAASFYALNRPTVISRRFAQLSQSPNPPLDVDDTTLTLPATSIDQTREPLSQSQPVQASLTEPSPEPGPKISRSEGTNLILLLALLAWVSALANGIIPSIQSYATLPFGNRIFHLSISLSSLANPCVCFLAFFYPVRQRAYIMGLALVATTISAYLFATAAMSPNPWLLGTRFGGPFNVLLWIAVAAIFSYVKVCVASQFHSRGKRWLLWCGVVTQAGSSIGAFIIFIMVNVMELFKSG